MHKVLGEQYRSPVTASLQVVPPYMCSTRNVDPPFEDDNHAPLMEAKLVYIVRISGRPLLSSLGDARGVGPSRTDQAERNHKIIAKLTSHDLEADARCSDLKDIYPKYVIHELLSMRL